MASFGNTFNGKPQPLEVIKQNRRLLKRRSSIAYRAYPSHPEINKLNYQERLFNNFKQNSSYLTDDMIKIGKHKQENRLNVATAPAIIDSCTQTSKTILQLAKLETGHLTPDSLTQSPREAERECASNKSNRFNSDHSCLKVRDTYSQFTLEGSVVEQPTPSLTYMRKNSLNDYLNNYRPVENVLSSGEEDKKAELYPKKSLTETFLKRKQQTNIQPTCHCRSRFLQQTSPLRNLPKEITSFPFKKPNDYNFKSQSFIESQANRYVCNESDISNKLNKQLPVSRFTVKHVRESEQPSIDKAQPMQCYWTQGNEITSKFENVYEGYNDDGIDGDINNSDKEGYNRRSRNTHTKRSGSFMSPTIASEQRNQQYKIQTLKNLISPTRRGRSLSPTRKSRPASEFLKKANREKIPYIDESKSHLEVRQPVVPREIQQRNSIARKKEFYMPPVVTRPKFDEDLLRIDLQSLEIKPSEETLCESVQPSCSTSISSNDNMVATTMAHIRNPDWNIALRGLAEMTELCRIMDANILYPHMTTVNQKLLELLRSPRSHVCRTACQAAGHFFESMKDTRKPEFDNIVEVLLCKTADANKFIRKDANLSLDCMVTHISIVHSIRSLCLKGPTHKNALVRTATIRLIVCAVVITGPDVVLNGTGHEHTRKRIIQNMMRFLEDKDLETRKYAERLYKVLSKESMFETVLKRILEKEEIIRVKNALKSRHEKK